MPIIFALNFHSALALYLELTITYPHEYLHLHKISRKKNTVFPELVMKLYITKPKKKNCQKFAFLLFVVVVLQDVTV